MIGDDYLTKKELFLFRLDDPYSKAKQSLNTLGRDLNGPQTIEMYWQNPKKWSSVEGVVVAEERLRIVDMLLVTNPTAGRMIFVYAEIMSGPHRGKLVDITSISKQDYRPNNPLKLIPMHDPELLKHVRIEME